MNTLRRRAFAKSLGMKYKVDKGEVNIRYKPSENIDSGVSYPYRMDDTSFFITIQQLYEPKKLHKDYMKDLRDKLNSCKWK